MQLEPLPAGEGLARGGDPLPSATLPEDEDESTSAAPLKPHLFVVFEADRPAAGGARYSLEGIDEVVVGRGDDRSTRREITDGRRRLTVHLPSARLSSHHLSIVRGHEGWTVRDMASKNGTLLNDSPVAEALLHPGDWLEAGRTFLVLHSAIRTPQGANTDVDARATASWALWQRTLYPEIRAGLDLLERAATSTVPVLLLGETGTGKELLARAVHERSKRDGPLVPVNCGALPGSLVEALLLGHVRGAFSDALRDEPGFIRSADRGTLFLDEIGDLPLSAQASLLRVLQDREVVAVGATRGKAVDFRLVCATHQGLDALVTRGAFRADLLSRIDGFRYTLLPLRRRREDLGLITANLLTKLAPGREHLVSFARAAARALVGHDWPGNVRELEQTLARALALSPGGQIGVASVAAASQATLRLDVKGFLLREQLIAELERHKGNLSQVALAMGKARMQIQRWMRKFDLCADAYRDPQAIPLRKPAEPTRPRRPEKAGREI